MPIVNSSSRSWGRPGSGSGNRSRRTTVRCSSAAPASGANRLALVLDDRRFVKKLLDEVLQADANLVSVTDAKLLAERRERHHRLGHGPVSTGAANVREEAAHELAGIFRVAEVPDRDDEVVVDDAADDGPLDVLE